MILKLFLFVAVPLLTGFKFYVPLNRGAGFIIIGRKYGLPAEWTKRGVMSKWYSLKRLVQAEEETYNMVYSPQK